VGTRREDLPTGRKGGPRLHFPVSGISISRTLFFVPARIPQDSFGFLFFPEEFFTGTSFWQG
jgi:hypothetical protein